MVIKKLNSVFSKHSRLLFGIFALLIIIAFTPGLMGGCNEDPSKQQAGTAFGEKVTYRDLSKFSRKVSVAMMMLYGNRAAQLDNEALFQMYCMEKYAERLGLTVSNKEIADKIKTLPVAMNKDGNFDMAQFDKFIKETGLSDEDISNAVGLIVTMDKLSTLNQSANNVSDQEAEMFYRMNNNQYTLEFCVIDPAKFKVDTPKPGDLEKYYEANKARFTKDNKQLTFKEAKKEVEAAYKQEKQAEKAIKFVSETAQKIKDLKDRKAAAKEFAKLKKYGTFTTITYPDDNLNNDMNKLMLVYPLINNLPMLYPGDIEAFMSMTGSPAFVRVVKRGPSDMSKFEAEKEQIKLSILRMKQQQGYQRIMAEINKQCKSNIPQKEQAE